MKKNHDSRFQTMRHIETVRNYLNVFIKDLLVRGEKHDQSKLENPELSLFNEHSCHLRTTTYGSDEYYESLEKMKPAIEHHYAHNKHHPEHFKDGVLDMTLIDLIEMLVDWKSSTLRHNDGNILRSLEINKERFNIPDPLYRILENTIDWMENQEVYHRAEQS